MAKFVKCAHCGLQGEKDKMVRFNNKNYHELCVQEEKDKKELCDYIVKIFGLKAPGPRNYALIKKYKEENGYSYRSMLYSLKFFYEVQNNTTDKSHESIGIIPYIYEDAKKYYGNLAHKKTNLAETINKQAEAKTVVVQRKQKKPRQIKLIDLEEAVND